MQGPEVFYQNLAKKNPSDVGQLGMNLPHGNFANIYSNRHVYDIILVHI